MKKSTLNAAVTVSLARRSDVETGGHPPVSLPFFLSCRATGKNQELFTHTKIVVRVATQQTDTIISEREREMVNSC